jgi:uncharacterized protein (DUF2062 family)
MMNRISMAALKRNSAQWLEAFFEKVRPMPQRSSLRDPKAGAPADRSSVVGWKKRRPSIRSGVMQYFEKCSSQGVSPRRLALTLALGLAIGCIPVVGIPTLVCAALALTLRLNLPAIQAANYAVMPLQFLLIVPFVRLGTWLFASGQMPAVRASAFAHASPLTLIHAFGGLAAQALLAWLVLAIPAVILLTVAFTPLLRRVPALAAAGAGD